MPDAEELALKDGKWSTHRIFEYIFGTDYNAEANTYGGRNAGATRLSIALIEAGVKLRREFLTKADDLTKRGFIASVRDLHAWLSTPTPDVWGNPDITIPGGSTLAKVARRIGERNGVYIILNNNHKDDVATLWQYDKGDVIEGKNNIDKGGTIYFWELKGETDCRYSFVRSRNVLHLILPDAPKRLESGFINVVGETIFVDYNEQYSIRGPSAFRKDIIGLYMNLMNEPPLSTIKERYGLEMHKKLVSGAFHYIHIPLKYRHNDDVYLTFAFYHELAHILHPEGFERNRENDEENIRSEYVADKTAVAKLGWGVDEYSHFISRTYDKPCIQDMLSNENWDVPEKYSKKEHYCHAKSRLLKALEYERKTQIGK
jgi:hypothetical protein